MRVLIAAVALAAAVFSQAHRLSADELIEGASKDNSLIYSADGSLSNGAGQTFFVGATNQGFPGDLRRGLIDFDTSSIPKGSVITGVTMTLFMDRTVDTTDRLVSAYRVTQDWGQGTSNAGGTGNGGGGGAGAPATQNDATWLYTFYNAKNPTSSPMWNTPGGDHAAVASAGTMVGTIPSNLIGTVADPYSWSGSGMIADVQSWVNNPGTNFGWLLMTDESDNGTARRFDSMFNSIVADRPVIQIDYTTAAVTPEPGSIALLTSGGAAALVLLRRRWRTAHARNRL